MQERFLNSQSNKDSPMKYDKKFGSHFKKEKGYKIKIGRKNYSHFFGGTDWKVVDKERKFDGPVLLLNLDLNDPCLKKLKTQALTELPLCTYLNCNIWEDDQLFQIFPEMREVRLIKYKKKDPEILDEEDRLPNPLPKTEVYLEELTLDESPLDEDSYWESCDMLLGGCDFIRLLQPLWLQEVEMQICSCGKQMTFAACVGYENYEISNGFLGAVPFFIGEAALYFFICHECLLVKSICQSS